MLRDSLLSVEGLCRRQGIEIVNGEDLRRGHFLVVGTRVLIFVPDWAKGHDIREGEIARQLVLFAATTIGEAGVAEMMGQLRQALVIPR